MGYSPSCPAKDSFESERGSFILVFYFYVIDFSMLKINKKILKNLF
jgi:hypothetical protein